MPTDAPSRHPSLPTTSGGGAATQPTTAHCCLAQRGALTLGGFRVAEALCAPGRSGGPRGASGRVAAKERATPRRSRPPTPYVAVPASSSYVMAKQMISRWRRTGCRATTTETRSATSGEAAARRARLAPVEARAGSAVSLPRCVREPVRSSSVASGGERVGERAFGSACSELVGEEARVMAVPVALKYLVGVVTPL
jgi:hypothetical protein